MELIKLTTPEFRKMAALIYKRTGIHLPETKLTLLSNRLRKRLRALKLDRFAAYYKLLCDEARCEEELPHFLSAVTTNETYFFRNENLWKFIQETWIPQIVEQKSGRSKAIRIWSAACSTGEEAYTTAICLLETLPRPAEWRVSIIGSDLSPRVLQHARAGVYNDYAVSKLSTARLRKWFETKDGTYVVKPELRKRVTFQSHNLRDPFPYGKSDLVFLRNVLMYFDTAMKRQVLVNVMNAVLPGGYMIVGDVDPIRNHAELKEVVTLEYAGPNVYHKPPTVRHPVTACVGKSIRHE